jgi:N,N'-diacetyllegionaminate synthase
MGFEGLKNKVRDGVFVIAEAGVNHNGEISIAKELVDVAVDAKCDAVKFQTWITEKVYSRSKSVKPEYHVRTTGEVESAYDTIKQLELSFAAFEEIKAYCDKRGIAFFSTPDEIESARFLAGINVPWMKTASQDVTNIPFLRQLANMGIPMIFSTGAASLDEVAAAVEVIQRVNRQLVILHCVSSYPAPWEEMNLEFIATLRRMYPECIIGFSDHTTGSEVAAAALALGARVFEKHFTLDRNMAGPDHQASLNPRELADYTQVLRRIHQSLGDGRKRVMPCEEGVRRAFRRFLVVDKNISRGAAFVESDFVFKKTVDGIPPAQIDTFIGRRASRDISADTVMAWELVDFGH